MGTKNVAMTAAEELSRLDAAEEELRSRRESLWADIDAASKARGAAILDATVAGKEPEASAQLEQAATAALTGIDAAIAETHRRRPAVARMVREEEAAAWRAKAEKLVAEADKREATTNRLLDELEAFEGVRFEPPTRWLPPGRNTTPRSTFMRKEAQACFDRAAAIERELAV